MDQQSLIGVTLDRKYKLIELLGKGGMGSVYEAEHQATRRRVAVKVIDSRLLLDGDGVQRFRREARTAGAIDSEHIVSVLDSGTCEATGLLYLVMEYLKGEDLQHLIDRTGPLAPDAALRVTAQALLGLSQAHEARIVHRDIKPSNIFLARRQDDEISVTLLDFGIAKIKADPADLPHITTLTNSDGFLGSPLYMSPEQVQSSRDVDFRTDLWSLASVLYCALAGRAPYAHVTSVAQLILAICTSLPPPLQDVAPWVPAEVAEVVHRALSGKPDARYPSAAAMLEAMRPLLPDGFSLCEEMLVPVSAEQRAAVAPRHRGHPLPSSPQVVALPRFTTTRDLGDTVGPLDTTILQKEDPPEIPPMPAPPARSRAILAAGAVVTLGIGGALWTWQRSPPAPMPAPIASASASASGSAGAEPPAPSASAAPGPIQVVKLDVFPSDASVEIDGVPVTVLNGVVEIRGPLGSPHTVRLLKKGMKEMRPATVFVTEMGAQPAKLSLSPLARTGPRPALPASASAQALPPKPRQPDDDIRRGQE